MNIMKAYRWTYYICQMGYFILVPRTILMFIKCVDRVNSPNLFVLSFSSELLCAKMFKYNFIYPNFSPSVVLYLILWLSLIFVVIFYYFQ